MLEHSQLNTILSGEMWASRKIVQGGGNLRKYLVQEYADDLSRAHNLLKSVRNNEIRRNN